MIRLYIENICSNIIKLNAEHEHYLRNVMRCNNEDLINIFDDLKEYTVKINFPNLIILHENQIKQFPQPKLGISYIRKNKLEWAIEKATELNVSEIYLFISERTNLKHIDLKRLRKISIEAAEQCGRVGIPKIYDNLKLQDLPNHNWVVADISASMQKTWHGDGILIGPEGGWSENDKKLLSNYKKVTLHNNVLRAETAVCTGLSMFEGI